MNFDSQILWYLLALVLLADLALSVSRASYTSLGLIFRRSTLAKTPILGRRVQQEGFARAAVRIHMSLQIGKESLFLLVVGILFTLLSGGSVPVPLGLSLFAALVIEVVLDQLVGRGLAAALGPERAFRITAPFLSLALVALLPLSGPILGLLARIPGDPLRGRRDPDEEVPEEEVEEFINAGRREGILEQDEGRMVRSIVEFGDTLVREVMTPRGDMITIARTATAEELRQLVAREMHSRIPVHEKGVDRIVGVIHIKDLLSRWDDIGREGPVESLMRPPCFVPETKKVAELLRDFQRDRIQIAVVVDEFGGTTGLVTLEDLLEEIVGEIRDEHESGEEPIRSEGNGVYLVRGAADVEQLESLFQTPLDSDDYESVGGLISTALGRIPARGEVLRHRGLRMEVVDADRKRIHLVRIRRSGPSPEAG